MPGRYLSTNVKITGIYLELKRRGGEEDGLCTQYVSDPESLVTPKRT